MSDPLYRSVTRAIPIGELPTALRNALVQHADRRKLKLVEGQSWLTHRTNAASTTMLGRLLRRRANHADRDAFHEMVLVVLPTHLMIATSGTTRGTSVVSVPLLNATASRGSGSDEGLSVGGFVVGSFAGEVGDSTTHFMGLGAGPSADACAQAAIAAVDAAKLPAA